MLDPCRQFEERLHDFVGGTLPAAEGRALQQHVENCWRCAALVDLVQGTVPSGVPEGTLVSRVLQSTSGNACQRAQALLCDFVDAALAPEDAALLRGHLQHCSACSAVAQVLVLLRSDLVQLQEVTADARFLDDVLQATSAAPQAGPGLAERLGRWWDGLLQRPRFAWEVAWVGTAILLLLCGAPRSPLRDVPQSALAIVQTDPTTLWRSMQIPMERSWSWVRDDVEGAWDASGGRLVTTIDNRRMRWSQQHPQASESWQSLQGRMPTLRQAVADGNLAQASWVLTEMGGDIRNLWHGMRPVPAQVPGSPTTPDREESK